MDGNFSLFSSKSIVETKNFPEEKLQLITTWLTDSGLKVNASKTELRLFYRKDTQPIEIMRNNAAIISKNPMNILDITFFQNTIGATK